ncbi:hypothetical protein BDZ97DRAFT_1366290 [Flammula alnicola]|nr:hypothetical protein BDZ97DRAFT_1366290 [Flammula alnicola]
MADIVEEKRKSSPKIEFEERKRILFHIESVQGLPQAGWQPVASTFVSVESLDTRESFPTEYKKTNSAIVWGENIPIIDLKDSSKVRFEVRSHVLWNKTVLGKTETFSVRELIKMQNDVGEDRDAFISLILTLPPSTHASASPTHQTSFKSPSSPNSKIPTLSFSIREIATKDRNNTITAVDLQRFVERCQSEALEELREIVEKIVHLRQAFEGSSFVCLLDIILGVSEGVRKAITNPITKNINKNTVACIKALNCALVPYQSLSGRQLAKTSENSTVLMKEMLCGAVKALACVETS